MARRTFNPQSLGELTSPRITQDPPPENPAELKSWLERMQTDLSRFQDWIEKAIAAGRRDFGDLQIILEDQETVQTKTYVPLYTGASAPGASPDWDINGGAGILIGTGGAATAWVLPLPVIVGDTLNKIELQAQGAQNATFSVIVRNGQSTQTFFRETSFSTSEVEVQTVSVDQTVKFGLTYYIRIGTSAAANPTINFTGCWITLSRTS